MLSEAELISIDDEARRDALDVTRSFIVQAPAGSGKTELLIQRYLRLLTVVGQPEDILAITFTNKAAREMQLRVLKALRQARDGHVGESAHERLTISTAAVALARDAEKDWHLIESPGRMRIQTVDAFGAGIARSLPLSSGLGAAGTTMADAGMMALYRDAAAATLDYLVAEDGTGDCVERVLVHLDGNTSLYVDYLSKMLASREQWLAITGSGDVDDIDAELTRRQLQQNLTRVIDGQLVAVSGNLPQECHAELNFLLRYAATNLIAGGHENHPLVVFAESDGLPLPEAAFRDRWQAIANLLLIQSRNWRKSINKNDGFPPGDNGQKQRLYDLITSLHRLPSLLDSLDRARLLPAPEYPDAQWEVLRALFRLLPLAAGELRRLFGERGVTDHNEVAIAAGRALGDVDEPGDIALILDYKIKHLLVDEMQDTSISQYELLKKLTAGWVPGDGRSIFCVGDPMQSIYRFRNAEVGEFLLAREHGIGDIKLESLLLRRNFRSGENLVHWFNTVFGQILPLKDDMSVGAIAYSDSVPVEHHAGCGEYVVHPLFGADSKEEATATLSVIRQCLADDGNITVLVRSRTQLAELLPLLRGANIEYQAIEIDRLTDLPEVIDVLALTRALVHSADRLAWLALLRGPWVGLTWHDLHVLVRNDVELTVPELCDDSDRTAMMTVDGADRLRHFMAMIKPFLDRTGTRTLRDRTELAWYALGGPAILRSASQFENIVRYFNALEKLEKAGTLEDVRELENRLDDERVTGLVSSECRVQIMTMHKAKGLQFDHVILPGLGRPTRQSDRDVLNWLTVPAESGGNEIVISPVGPRADVENDPLHRFIETSGKDKDNLELDRLLYVACTRAIRSLHLVGSVSMSQSRDSFRDPQKGSLLFRLWPSIQADFEKAFQRRTKDTVEDADSHPEPRLADPSLRRFAETWHAPLPASMPCADGAKADLSEVDEQEVEFYWVGSAARHAGTIVHRWLQRIADGLVQVDMSSPDAMQPVSRRWAEELGVSADQMEEVCDRTARAVGQVLADEKGRWVVHGEGAAELPLTGLVDGRVESIVIDRVRIDGEGTHWVIDYKTSTHEGGDLEGFLRQEANRYRPQLQKYAALYQQVTGARVCTALYFPLLQEFYEIS